jgi:hypothetical protein
MKPIELPPHVGCLRDAPLLPQPVQRARRLTRMPALAMGGVITPPSGDMEHPFATLELVPPVAVATHDPDRHGSGHARRRAGAARASAERDAGKVDVAARRGGAETSGGERRHDGAMGGAANEQTSIAPSMPSGD